MMFWGYGSGWGHLVMAVSMVVFWGLVTGAIVVIVRAGGHTVASAPSADQQPRQILAERFARGEVEAAEYRTRLAALRGRPTPDRPTPDRPAPDR